MSTLLMVAHDNGVPHITNSEEVAAILQVSQDLFHDGFSMGQTKILASVREKLILDFGGGVLVRWKSINFQLSDGNIFCFHAHQYTAVVQHVYEQMQQAEERGLGILRDQHFPVALSYEDLVAVYSWLLEGRVHFKRLEERMLQQAGSVIHKMISEQDGMLYRNPDLIPSPAEGMVLMVPGPSEVH